MRKRHALAIVALICVHTVAFAAGTQSADAARDTIAVTPPGTFPVVEDKQTLNIFAANYFYEEGFDIETNWFTEFYEDKTNVHIDWELVSGGGEQVRQKVNLKLASGDYPDVFSRIGFSRAEQVRYGSEGVFLPIGDLVDNQTVHIKKAFEEVNRLRDSCTTPDGNMYGLPNPVLYVHGTMPNKMWVYKPWVDAVFDGKMPETTDEFYEMLKAFKEQDPNGNGKADEVPYATMGANYVFLMNSFTWYDGGILKVENDVISCVVNTDEYREGIRYLARLYTDGLYVQDFFTLDRKQIRELGEADPNTLGAGTGLGPWDFSRNTGDDANFWGYEALMPLEGPDGTRQHPFRHLALGPGGGQWNITHTCESPELAMRWLDWIWSYDGYHTASHGPALDASAEEGPGWRPGRQGEVGSDGKQATIKRVPTEDPTGYQNVHWGTNHIVPRYLAYEWHTGVVVDDDDPWRSQDLWESTMEMYEWRVDLTLPPLFMPQDVASEIAELETALSDTVRQATAQFIYGARDIKSDAEWNKYLDDLDRLGLDRLTELYQAEYLNNYGD